MSISEPFPVSTCGRLITLNSCTDVYWPLSTLCFIVLKSMGLGMMLEYPGAMLSVTGKAKMPLASFLKDKKYNIITVHSRYNMAKYEAVLNIVSDQSDVITGDRESVTATRA